MSNPETASIIERLIACRDTLQVVERQYSVNLQPERAAMADAANALSAYDKTMTRIAEDAPKERLAAITPAGGVEAPKGQEAEGPDIERDDDALVIRWWGPGHASCYSPTYLGDGKVVTALSTKGGSRTAINPTGERVFADLEALAASPTRDEATEGDGQDQGGKG